MLYILRGVKYRGILQVDYLAIPDKTFTCITGESGSGKTTLLRMLNNLSSPDEGEILFRGENINNLAPHELRRRAVMLPQAPAIFEGTIKDNLLAGRLFAEKSALPDEELLAVLQTVRLNKGLLEDAENLSGGEKQRLAIARVLLMSPEVLLLDEPSSALDEDTEQEVIDNLYRYVRENDIAAVMVTHAKNVARRYSRFTVEMKNGRITNIPEMEVEAPWKA